MTFAVAVRTVPQRATMFGELLSRLVHDGLRVCVSADATVAPNENACLALELARAGSPDWVVFLEDDAGLIDDFFGSVERWLADHEQADVHAYPLGYQYATMPGTSWRYPISHFYCSVALALRASMVPSLVAYLRANSHVRQGFDLMLGNWHRTVSESPYLIAPVPCFVEHLGDVSTLIDGRPDRNEVGRFQGFPGYDYTYPVDRQVGKERAHG